MVHRVYEDNLKTKPLESQANISSCGKTVSPRTIINTNENCFRFVVVRCGIFFIKVVSFHLLYIIEWIMQVQTSRF